MALYSFNGSHNARSLSKCVHSMQRCVQHSSNEVATAGASTIPNTERQTHTQPLVSFRFSVENDQSARKSSPVHSPFTLPCNVIALRKVERFKINTLPRSATYTSGAAKHKTHIQCGEHGAHRVFNDSMSWQSLFCVCFVRGNFMSTTPGGVRVYGSIGAQQCSAPDSFYVCTKWLR